MGSWNVLQDVSVLGGFSFQAIFAPLGHVIWQMGERRDRLE